MTDKQKLEAAIDYHLCDEPNSASAHILWSTIHKALQDQLAIAQGDKVLVPEMTGFFDKDFEIIYEMEHIPLLKYMGSTPGIKFLRYLMQDHADLEEEYEAYKAAQEESK